MTIPVTYIDLIDLFLFPAVFLFFLINQKQITKGSKSKKYFFLLMIVLFSCGWFLSAKEILTKASYIRQLNNISIVQVSQIRLNNNLLIKNHQLNQIISHFQGNTKPIVLTDINVYQSKPKIPINIFYKNQNNLQFLILPHPTKSGVILAFTNNSLTKKDTLWGPLQTSLKIAYCPNLKIQNFQL